MKNYKSLTELAHIWVQQNPDYSEGKSGRYYFKEDVLYLKDGGWGRKDSTLAKFIEGYVVYDNTLVSGRFGGDTIYYAIKGALDNKDLFLTTRLHIYDTILENAQANLIQARLIRSDWEANGKKKALQNNLEQANYLDTAEKFAAALTDAAKATLPKVQPILTQEEREALYAKSDARRDKLYENREVAFPAYIAAIEALIDKRTEEREAAKLNPKSPEEVWRETGKFREEIPLLIDGEKISFKHDGKTLKWVLGRYYDFGNYPKIQNAWEWYNLNRGGRTELSHTCLRLDGGYVETSEGALVSLREAKIMYEMLKQGKDIKGFKIGAYTVINKADDGIKIGCHFLPFHEIQLFANTMGW